MPSGQRLLDVEGFLIALQGFAMAIVNLRFPGVSGWALDNLGLFLLSAKR